MKIASFLCKVVGIHDMANSVYKFSGVEYKPT